MVYRPTRKIGINIASVNDFKVEKSELLPQPNYRIGM